MSADYHSDIFVTRINANGTYGWTRRMGGFNQDSGYSIIIDASLNVYITGYFRSTVDFGADFGVSDIKTSAGGYDVFVTKINSNGTYGWTKQIGDSDTDKGHSITTDRTGNVFTIGYFRGTVNFSKDFGFSDRKTSAGKDDVIVMKINSTGTYGWTKRFGGTDYDSGFSVTTDSLNNLYLAGIFRETVDFGADFEVSDIKTSADGYDIFITKIYP